MAVRAGPLAPVRPMVGHITVVARPFLILCIKGTRILTGEAGFLEALVPLTSQADGSLIKAVILAPGTCLPMYWSFVW